MLGLILEILGALESGVWRGEASQMIQLLPAVSLSTHYFSCSINGGQDKNKLTLIFEHAVSKDQCPSNFKSHVLAAFKNRRKVYEMEFALLCYNSAGVVGKLHNSGSWFPALPSLPAYKAKYAYLPDLITSTLHVPTLMPRNCSSAQ